MSYLPEHHRSIREQHHIEQMEARLEDLRRDQTRAMKRMALNMMLGGAFLILLGAILFREVRSSFRQHDAIATACIAEELNLTRKLLARGKLPAPTDVRELVASINHGQIVPMPDPEHAVLISFDRLGEQELQKIHWDGSKFAPIAGPTLEELHRSRQLDRVTSDIALLLIHLQTLTDLSRLQEGTTEPSGSGVPAGDRS